MKGGEAISTQHDGAYYETSPIRETVKSLKTIHRIFFLDRQAETVSL